MPALRRTIRLFVSSTFADLLAERDILHRKVFPEIRCYCLERGLHFQPIDLRWGVSDEASRHNRTMRICLRELARCQEGKLKPNFLIILGDRYGWCPPPEIVPADLFERMRPVVEVHSRAAALGLQFYCLDRNADPPAFVLLPRPFDIADDAAWSDKVERPLVEAMRQACSTILAEDTLPPVDRSRLQGLAIGRSATHQEILHGALRVPDAASHVHAFARQRNDGSTPDPDLTALNREIEAALGPHNVHKYPAVDRALAAFHAGVLKVLKQVIDHEAESLAEVSAMEEEKGLHSRFGGERRAIFRGRERELDRIHAYLMGGGDRAIAVLGEGGAGKSALMANAAEHARELNFVVVERYVAASPRSADILTLLGDTAAEIRQSLGGTPPSKTPEVATLAQARETLLHTMHMASAERPLAIFLDGLDLLTEGSYGRKLNWLPGNLPSHVRLVVCCTLPPAEADPVDPRHEVYQAISAKVEPEECIIVGRLNDAQGAAILDFLLHDAGRVLQPEQRKAVLSSFSHHGNALWLRVAASESARMPSWVAAPQFPDRPAELFRYVLNHFAEPLEHGHSLVERTVGYLSASRRGLSEGELLDLLSGDREVMDEFRCRFPKAPATEQLPVTVWAELRGDLDPYLSEVVQHGQVLLAISQSYFRESIDKGGDPVERHRALATHFHSQPFTEHTVEELPWQLLKAENWDGLANLLSAPGTFAAVSALSRSDAKFYWTALERNSDSKAPHVFAEVIHQPAKFPDTALLISDLLEETSYPDEARQLLEQLVRTYPPSAPMEGYLAAFMHLGILQMQAGEYEACEETFRSCRIKARMAGQRPLEGAALLNLAIALRVQSQLDRADVLLDAFFEGEYDVTPGRAYFEKAQIAQARTQTVAAEDSYDRALAAAEEAGDDDLRNEVLEQRAALLTAAGRVTEGEYDLTQAAGQFDKIGDAKGSVRARMLVGVIEKDRGNLKAAIEQYKRAAEFDRRLGRTLELAMALDNHAEALIRMGKYEEALPLNLQAEHIFRERNATRHLAIALLNQSSLRRGVLDGAAAQQALEEARRLSIESHDSDTEARTLLAEAEMRLEEKKFEEAERIVRQAIPALEAAGAQDGLAYAHGLLGRLIAEYRKRPIEALPEFDKAFEIGIRRDLRTWVIELLLQICSIYAKLEEDQIVLDAADELARQAARHQDFWSSFAAAMIRSEALAKLEHYVEARGAAEEAVNQAHAIGGRRLIADAKCALAKRLRDCGDASRALVEGLEAETLYADDGVWDAVVQSQIFRAQTLHFDLGRSLEAAEVLRSALELDRNSDEGQLEQRLVLTENAIRNGQAPQAPKEW